MTEVRANSSFNQLGTQHILCLVLRQHFLVIFPMAVVFRTVGCSYGIYKHSCPGIFIASFGLSMLPLRILMRRGIRISTQTKVKFFRDLFLHQVYVLHYFGNINFPPIVNGNIGLRLQPSLAASDIIDFCKNAI